MTFKTVFEFLHLSTNILPLVVLFLSWDWFETCDQALTVHTMLFGYSVIIF